jgi:biotin carboxyl carrier protein
MTLQLTGQREPASFEIDWRGEREGWAEFALAREGETLCGSGRLGPGGEGTLRLGARLVPFFVVRAGREIQVCIDGQVYRLADPQTGSGASPAATRSPQTLPVGGEITAPMPGLVLKLLAKPGEEVAAQAPLLILESMKMELTLAAPEAGRLVEVFCREGQRVELGTVLMRVEGRG